MKKDFIFYSILFPLLMLIDLSFAQDTHFTQFNASPQNLNPAQTGLFNGDWRFVANYRTQWSAITVPYNTYSIAADTRLNKKIKNCIPTLGLVVNSDKTGDSRFTTTQVFLSAGIIKQLNKDSTHFLSVAIQPGFSSKNFNANALTFNSQYDGNSYNSSVNSGETFTNNRITYFDGGAGIAYLWKKSNRTQLNIGASLFHINNPQQSFFNNGNIRLDTKAIISGVAEFPVTAKLDILPTFFYQKQGIYNETDIGFMGKYYLKPINGMTTSTSLGFMYRSGDACNVIAMMQYQGFNVGVSYDLNLSRLKVASEIRGAFEISVIYIFKKSVNFVAKQRFCPVYM